MELYDVVLKLIGDITPYGDSNIDSKRINNLKEQCSLSSVLIEDLINVAQFKERPEHSIKIMGELAHDTLIGIKEMLNEISE